MTKGYIYCFSNPSMVVILKVGITERTPELRLKEANSSNTWKPPTPYKIEFAKKVTNPKQKEFTLHILLAKYTERIDLHREFFRISKEDIIVFFDLIDGEIWIEKTKSENESKYKSEEEEYSSEEDDDDDDDEDYIYEEDSEDSEDYEDSEDEDVNKIIQKMKKI